MLVYTKSFECMNEVQHVSLCACACACARARAQKKGKKKYDSNVCTHVVTNEAMS